MKLFCSAFVVLFLHLKLVTCLNTGQAFETEPVDTSFTICQDVEIKCAFIQPGMVIWAKVTGNSTHDTLFQHMLNSRGDLIYYNGQYSMLVSADVSASKYEVNLRMFGATPSLAGDYECMAVSGTNQLIRKKITLTFTPPGGSLCSSISLVDKVAWVDGSGNVRAGMGTHCGSTFKCNCISSISAAKWYQSGVIKTAWGSSLDLELHGSAVRASQVQVSGASGPVSCSCNNGSSLPVTANKRSSEIEITYAIDRPMMKISPTRFPTAGSNVKITCAVGCNHPSWHPGVMYIKDGVGQGAKGKTATYDINNFEEKDNGEYSCKHKVGFGGPYGKSSFPVTIHIKIDPNDPNVSVSSCSVKWTEYWDKWSKQTYCFRADPSPNPNTPFSNRTYADASADCMGLNSKLATHHDDGADNMFPSDGSSRWIGVKYERDLEMYTYNDGVPMDTSWLSWTPWDTVGGHPNNGRGSLDCTVIANGKWRSVSCTDTFRFVCEYQECPYGWTYNPHVDRCNKHFFGPRSFQNATESCSELGAIVETARSVAAQRFLFGLGSETLKSLWIGLMNIAEKPVWRWNDGAKVTWTAWDGTSELKKRFRNQNCMFALKNESSTIWKRTLCSIRKAYWKAYVCGKATCRFPYQSIVAEGHAPFFHKCYRGMMNSRLNARQAGQFCAQDGSKSNPSRLAAPITQLEDDILHSRGKDPTASKRGNERYMFSNYGSFNYDRKWIGHVFNIYEFKNRWQWNDNTIGGGLANTSKSKYLDYVAPNERYLELCTMLRAKYWIRKPCDRLCGFVCEREQPYVLSTCPPSEDLTNLNASLLKGYHPKVAQSQRMKCYYHHADARAMNYAEADRFCSSLGGYIMMPKTRHDLKRFIYQISHTNPNHLWIGADSFGHCYNNYRWCTPNPNNFKYQDGSSLTSNNLIWSNGQPDDLDHKEACIVVDRDTSVISDIDCSTLSKVVCEVDHNNLRTHRNFDYITACQYQKRPHVGAWNADIDEPRLNVPWHAAPGDVCYRTPDSKGRGYKKYVDSCKSLETDSDTARPRDKDQTRSLVLSIMSTDVGLHVAPTSSYIGVWYWRVHTDKAKWLSTSYNGCPGSRWPPCDYEEFDAKFRNWSPDDTAPSGQRRSLKCVLITPNGKWVSARCNEGHYVSCQKPSVASLITWRTDQAAQLPSADESCSDRLHIQIRSIAVVVIISLALCS